MSTWRSNSHLAPGAVRPADAVARSFHAGLEGYAPTPLRELSTLAQELGLGRVRVKDESLRLGLPAFKVLGASWAVERALRSDPAIRALVAASAGNHGRAVAHVARRRGLACRILLPARALEVRRRAILDEGAEVVVVDGDYEDAVAAAAVAGGEEGVLEVADVGDGPAAHAVIDGYATLFAELDDQLDRPPEVLLVPVGVGSLAAAAARWGAAAGVRVIGVEPVTAACLTASLAAGCPVRVPTPGSVMAGMDCAEVSPAAWPDLRAGIAGTTTVADADLAAGAVHLEAAGLGPGECSAAACSALLALARDPDAREVLGLGADAEVVLLATEGRTSAGA